MAFNFEKLKVWQKAVEFSADIYEQTKSFPKDELYSLTLQIRKASDSISLNIAEGSTGQSKKEFSKFLGYAIRSGIEVIGCLYLALRKRHIEETLFKELYNGLEGIIIMIQALRKSLSTE